MQKTLEQQLIARFGSKDNIPPEILEVVENLDADTEVLPPGLIPEFVVEPDSKGELLEFLEKVSDLVFLLNEEGEFIYVGSTINEFLKYSGDELLGNVIYDFIHPDEQEMVMYHFSHPEYLNTKETVNYRFRDRRGTWISLSSTVSSLTKDENDTRKLVLSNRIPEDTKDLVFPVNREADLSQIATEVAREIAVSDSMASFFERSARLIADRFNFSKVTVLRYNMAQDTAILVSDSTVKKGKINGNFQVEAGEGVIGEVLVTKDFACNQDAEDPHEQKICAAPVQLGDKLLGILAIYLGKGKQLEPEFRRVLEILCSQMAVTLESLRVRAEVEERLRELDTLQQMSSKTGGDLFGEHNRLQGYFYDLSQAEARPLDEKSLRKIEGGEGKEDSDKNISRKLEIRGQMIGNLGIEIQPDEEIDEDDIALLDAISEEVAQALDRARLFESSQRSASELSVLNEMTSAFTEVLEEKKIISSLYEYTSRLVNSHNFYVAMYDEDNQRLTYPLVVTNGKLMTAVDEHTGPLEPAETFTGLTSHILRTREALMLNGINNEERLREIDTANLTKKEKKTASWLGVPMVVGDILLGVIVVHSKLNNVYTQHDVGLLGAVSSQAAIAIENARLFTQAQQSARELTILNEMGNAFTETLDVEVILENIFIYSSRLMQPADFLVALQNEEDRMVQYSLVVEKGEILDRADTRWEHYPAFDVADGGYIGYVIENRESLFFEENAVSEMESMGIPINENSEPIQSLMAVPMAVGNRVLGALVVKDGKNPGLYARHHLELLNSVASQAAIAIENARLFTEEQSRAVQERTVRTATDRIRSSLNQDAILRTTLEELGKILNAKQAVIQLGTREKLMSTELEAPEIEAFTELEGISEGGGSILDEEYDFQAVNQALEGLDIPDTDELPATEAPNEVGTSEPASEEEDIEDIDPKDINKINTRELVFPNNRPGDAVTKELPEIGELFRDLDAAIEDKAEKEKSAEDNEDKKVDDLLNSGDME